LPFIGSGYRCRRRFNKLNANHSNSANGSLKIRNRVSVSMKNYEIL